MIKKSDDNLKFRRSFISSMKLSTLAFYLLPMLMFATYKASAQSSDVYTESFYPEKWEWQPETYKAEGSSSINFYSLDNGDVLVSFVWSEESGGTTENHHEYFTFFGGQKFTSLEAAFITLEGHYSDEIRSRRRADSSSYATLLPNGKRVDIYSSSNPCARRLFSNIAVYDRANAEYKTHKTALLFFPDTPFIYPKADCGIRFTTEITKDVVMINATDVVPLRDNTFLIADEELGVIFRFDENLDSRSNLIGNRLFAINYRDLYESRFEFSDRMIANNSESVGSDSRSLMLDELKQRASRSGWWLEWIN